MEFIPASLIYLAMSFGLLNLLYILWSGHKQRMITTILAVVITVVASVAAVYTSVVVYQKAPVQNANR